MLQHLAGVVENGPQQSPGATYKEEAIDALLHGAELARESRMNLRHVARIYDNMVDTPLPDPRSRVAGESRGSD